MVNEKQKWMAFWKEIMSVSVQNSTQRTVCIPDRMTDGNVTEQTAWIQPALSCARKYVNDSWRREGDKPRVPHRRLRPLVNNVVLEQTFCPNGPLQNENHNIMPLKGLQNICIGAWFYVHYGETYSTPAKRMLKYVTFHNKLPNFYHSQGRGSCSVL